MNFIKKLSITASILLFLPSFSAYAGGISVDAGLTPGKDRWILRTQYRSMRMQNSTMTVKNNIFPLIVAYGISSNFTFIAKGIFVTRTQMMNSKVQTSGIDDPIILLKTKLYRNNTARMIIGIAPYFASNIPIGNREISDKTWNPELGISMSFRPRYWSFDLTLSYTADDILKKTGSQKSDFFCTNLALSSIVPLDNSAMAISPVLEFTYKNELEYNSNPLNKILYIAPGLIFIRSSIMIEGLFQIPLSQRIDASTMKTKSKLLIGMRYMF